MLQVHSTNFDGYEYEKSMNWHFKVLKYAKKTKEACEHFKKNEIDYTINTILINLSPWGYMIEGKPRFYVSCAQCEQMYFATSKKLNHKFWKFYGILRDKTFEDKNNEGRPKTI